MALKKRYSAAAHVPGIVEHCRQSGGVWTRHFRLGAVGWVFYGPNVVRMDDGSTRSSGNLLLPDFRIEMKFAF